MDLCWHKINKNKPMHLTIVSKVIWNACLSLAFIVILQPAQAFNHPGLYNNASDLNRAKAQVASGTEPWRSAWERLSNSNCPNSGYTIHGPYTTIGRNPDVNNAGFESDCAAAYYNAVEYWISGNPANATKAITILNDYSSTLKSVTGTDARLFGFSFCMMINAAEIIRSSNAGWSSTNITQFSNWLTNTIWPAVSANGPIAWGESCNNTMMCIGVFNNNTTQFNSGYNNYLGTDGNAGGWTTIFNNTSASLGQPSDVYRDEGHGQLDVECGILAAEICRNCGTGNLYDLDNHLLLNASEYVAKYNLLHHVTWIDMTGSDVSGISAESRGNFIPFYECSYAYYVGIKDLSAPYTTQVVNAQGVETWGTEDPGIGTLTHCQSSRNRPSPTYFMQQGATVPTYIMAGNNGASNLTCESRGTRVLEAFQEVIQGNGYSALRSLANGKYVTDPTSGGGGALIANSTTVGTAQEFKVVDLGGRQFAFVSALNGKYMGAVNNGTVTCTVGYPFYNSYNCQYVGTTVPAVLTGFNGNTYNVADTLDSLLVEVSGSSTSNGGMVDQWASNGGTNQQWTFTDVGNGFYTLKNVHSGLLMEAAKNSPLEGGEIDQGSNNGGANQQWMIQYVDPADPSSTYNFMNIKRGFALDDTSNSSAHGTPFGQWYYAGGSNDLFTITKP
jgi:hypothetical protein